MSNYKIKKNRMLTFFIEAAQEIISTEGIEGITLRKVSDLAGYNGATLYNYFKDLDHLILFASLKYIKKYNVEVVKNIKGCKTEREKVTIMWKTFCAVSFENPKPFYQIFFNKHSEDLEEISKQYYELFPEDMGSRVENLQCILTGTHLDVRNKIALMRLAKEENLPEEKIDIVNEMMIALYHDLLLKRINENESDKQEVQYYEDKMMAYFSFILNSLV